MARMKDFATIMAFSLVRRARQDDNDGDDIKLVAVPRDAVLAVVSTGQPMIPTAMTSQLADPPTTTSAPLPPHPAESEPAEPPPLPEAMRVWRELQSFRAGGQGPVSFPLDHPLPECPDGHVLIPSSALQLLVPRGSYPQGVTARAYLARKTAEEVRTKAVEFADWDHVTVILPVFVVENEDGKQRIIYDGRALNAYLKKAAGSVSYESVRDALIHTATVGTKMDVASAFRHVLVTPEQQKLLGFVVEGRLMRYRTLPFGVSWSPALFVACLRPVVERLRRAGVRLVWYVDDFLIVAESVAELDAALARVLRELASHGWYASPDKTYCHAYSVIPFLGLRIVFADTGVTEMRVMDAMRRKIIRDIDAMLVSGTAALHVLQKVTGRISFLQIVIPEVGFARTGLDRAVAFATRTANRQAPTTGLFRQQLIAIRDLFAVAVLERRVTATDDLESPGRGVHVFSDASETGWGVLRIDPSGPFQVPPELRGPDVPPGDVKGWSAADEFTHAEREQSSAAREILAMVYGIIALDLRDTAVMWHSDATAAVGAVRRWASPSPGVAAALRLLWQQVADRHLSISIQHVHRELSLMPAADWLSRVGWREAQAEWSFAEHDVATVTSAFRVTCDGDLFASRRNHRFPRFCSRFLEEGSRGDAFYQPWEGPGCWWAFPPFSQRSRIIARLVGYAVEAATESELRHLGSQAAGRQSSTPSSSSSSSSLLSVQVVLIIRQVLPSDPDAHLWARLRPAIVRSAWVSVPENHTGLQRVRPLLPCLRLIGDDGQAAPAPPHKPLLAHLIRIVGVPATPHNCPPTGTPVT